MFTYIIWFYDEDKGIKIPVLSLRAGLQDQEISGTAGKTVGLMCETALLGH